MNYSKESNTSLLKPFKISEFRFVILPLYNPKNNGSVRVKVTSFTITTSFIEYLI
jgi:hypothetical protein